MYHFIARFRRIVLPVLLLLLFPSAAVSQSSDKLLQYRSDRHGFAIKYPRGLTRVTNGLKGSLVFLAKPLGQTYPRLEVRHYRGDYDSRAVEAHTKTVVSRFYNAGYLDVEYQGLGEDNFLYMPKKRHSVTVTYSDRGKRIVSDVSYISGRNTHFVLTYSDIANRFVHNAALRDHVLNTFTLSKYNLRPGTPGTSNPAARAPIKARYNPPGHASGHTTGSDWAWSGGKSGPSMFGVFLLILLVIFSAATIFRQDAKKGD